MKRPRYDKPFPLAWPAVLGIICGIGLGMNACTTPPRHSSSLPPSTEKEIPPPDSPQSESSVEAETQLLETVRNAENLGEGNPLLMSSLYSLATYYEQQGEFEKAEEQYKRALSIKEKTSGPNHPDVAIILKNYAGLLRQAHRNEEAERLLTRANEIMAKRSSDTSPL